METNIIKNLLDIIAGDFQIFKILVALSIVLLILLFLLFLCFAIYLVLTKKAFKLLPDRIMYTEKIEYWLNKMAKQGLILKRIGVSFAIFKKGDSQDIKYRVMAYDGDYFEHEVIKLYERAGWTIIENDVSPIAFGSTTKQIKYYVFKVNQEQKPDKSLVALYNKTGINNKRIKEKKLCRTYKAASITFAIVAVIGYVVTYFLYISGILLTFSAVFALLAIVQSKEKQRIYSYENADKSEYGNYKEYFPRHIAKSLVTFFLKAVIVFYTILFAVSPYFLIVESNLDNVNNFIRLEDVQQAYKKDIMPTYGDYIPSPFITTFYRAEEIGLSKSENGSTKMVEYEIIYSKSLIPFLTYISSNACIAQRLNSGAYQFLGDTQYTSSEYFNKIAYKDFMYMGERTVELCLCNNNELIYIYYRGDKGKDEVIEAVEKTLYK